MIELPENIKRNGGWVKAEFLHAIVDVWVAPVELWDTLWRADNDMGKEIPPGYTLAQFADDAPYRILKLA